MQKSEKMFRNHIAVCYILSYNYQNICSQSQKQGGNNHGSVSYTHLQASNLYSPSELQQMARERLEGMGMAGLLPGDMEEPSDGVYDLRFSLEEKDETHWRFGDIDVRMRDDGILMEIDSQVRGFAPVAQAPCLLSLIHIFSDFTGCVVHSTLHQIGRLKTSNEKVNRLILNALWGQRGNYLDVPTDCPQRDERMGWTGDAQAFAATACFNMDSAAFLQKYLYDMQMEQDKMQGGCPHVVPAFEMYLSLIHI